MTSSDGRAVQVTPGMVVPLIPFDGGIALRDNQKSREYEIALEAGDSR